MNASQKVPPTNQSIRALAGMSITEWNTMATTLTIFFILATAGNITILIGSIKYKAIKLSRLISALIEHVAVCDIGVSIVCVLPHIITMVSDRWLFGEIFCIVRDYVGGCLLNVSMIFVCALNCSKLAFLLKPLKTAYWFGRRGHQLAGMIWALAIVFEIGLAISSKGDYVFYPSACGCGRSIHAFEIYFWIIPVVLVITTSAWLIGIAFKASRSEGRRSSLKMKGVVTVLLIALIFCISNLPISIFSLIREYRDEKQIRNSAKIIGITWCFTFLNSVGNFFIYIGSINSFKIFVCSTLEPVKCVNHKRTQVPTRGKLTQETLLK